MGKYQTGWWTKYESLELMNGRINFILDDDEDMIEIFYDDGMLIDVGKPFMCDEYYITVLVSDDEKGWNAPAAEIAVKDKDKLLAEIQSTIYKFRSM